MNSATPDSSTQPLAALRRRLHARPELAFQEHATAQLVADELRRAGVDELHSGIGGTGVVAVIRRGTSRRSIGIRADMDALALQETGDIAHRSTVDGVMHACGHDGHTAILLGTARALAESARFDGAVHLIFQPAEEGRGGARAMIEDGLFERFSIDRVFALHNWPGLPVGQVAIKSGAMMGAVDRLEIRIHGTGAHAAQPHHGVDPIVVAAQVITALQTIVSRSCAPTDAAVLSVTGIQAGTAINVIPATAILRGTVRTVDAALRDRIERLLRRTVESVCSALGAGSEIDFVHGTPATINDPDAADLLRSAAIEALGAAQVQTLPHPSLGGEDFACMLAQRPGAFIRLGNGPSAGLHNPAYDFNDDAIPVGVALWTRLVERLLPVEGAPA